MTNPARTRLALGSSLALLLSAGTVLADTVIVDPTGNGDVTSLQGGIDLAVNGDEVLVRPGTYIESPVISGKEITVRATGPGRPFVIGPFTVEAQTGSGSLVSGFQLFEGMTLDPSTGANAAVADCTFGETLWIQSGYCTVSNCEFDGLEDAIHQSGDFGGGVVDGCLFEDNTRAMFISGYEAGFDINNCQFEGNGIGIETSWAWNPTYQGAVSFSADGCAFVANGTVFLTAYTFGGPASGRGDFVRSGGLLARDCEVRGNSRVFSLSLSGLSFIDSEIVDNLNLGSGSSSAVGFRRCLVARNGGGISLGIDGIDNNLGSSLAVRETTYYQNEGGFVVGGNDLSLSSIAIDRSILVENTDGDVNPEELPYTSASISCSNFYGNAEGDDVPSNADAGNNFSADPLFCDPAAGDFFLAPTSPCLAGNSPSGCDQIGAFGDGGCDVISVSAETWSGIKAKYR